MSDNLSGKLNCTVSGKLTNRLKLLMMKFRSSRRLVIFAIVLFATIALIRISVLYDKQNIIAVPLHERMRFIINGLDEQQENNLQAHRSKTTPQETKLFLYLIQTEQCLPSRLLDKNHLGKTQQHRFDVIVLSFKKPCMGKNKTLFAHVQYVFPGSENRVSWSAGRNLLYDTSKSRNSEYLYYIFMDDDLEFSYNEPKTPERMKSVSPMRSFENFLLEYEPAVGLLNYLEHHNADTMIRKIKTFCREDKLNMTRFSVYVPIVHFDASFNAFHKDAVSHILPYLTLYDKTNWWHSQRYVISLTELKFRGQSYLFIPVNSKNPKHSEYPRNDANANQVWSSFVKNLILAVPVQYRNEGWVQEFSKNPVKHTENSLAICWKLPKRHPIRPYAHFAFNQDLI